MVSILAGNGLGCDQPLKAVAASLERFRKDDTAPAGVTFVQLRCELERLKHGLVVRGIDHSEYLLCRTVDDDKGFGRRGTGPVIIASNDKLDKTVLTICRCLRRSEEHTSELQSHSDLVCRLLLEKKKKKKN